jgi:acetyl-CoA synthetase
MHSAQELFIEPSEGFCQEANLNLEKYQELQNLYLKNPDEFWSFLARENLFWQEPFNKVSEIKSRGDFEWFMGGTTNISYNCIDIHLKNKAQKTAITFEGELGEVETITYQELYYKVCQFANLLKKVGVKKGSIVCIYLPLCIEAIIAMQACLRLGAVHSVVFAGFSAQALKDRIEELDSQIILTADGLIRKGEIVKLLFTVNEAIENRKESTKIICFDRIKKIYDTHKKENLISYLGEIKTLKANLGAELIDWQNYKKMDQDCPCEWLDSEDTSFILFTSGSTGKPKGLLHTTAGYLLASKLTTQWVFDLKDTDIFWCTADIGWITGHSYVAYGPLSNGASIFIYEGAPNYPDKNRFWSLIEKHKISIFYTAPTAIRAFMQWGFEDKHDLSSLRLLGSVGEPINPSAWMWFYEKIGKSKCPIVDTWWQTETGAIMVTTLPGIDKMKPGSAGRPLPGIQAEVIYEDTNKEVGTLYIKQPVPSMARTIYKDKSRYLATYWASPNGYLPGDAAIQDDFAYITIEGRIDDVINVSGHRLGTAEIESALVAHPNITEAAVVSIPHELKGEGIIAFVVSNKENNKNTQDEFKAQVVKEIGAIARPEKIIICSALPKTRSGKIMRRLLKEIAQGKKTHGDISTLENSQVLKELEG